MARILKHKRGLSHVVTTLIILVVAVLLTSVVTYYATNMTMTRTRQEEVRITKQHIWVNSTGAVAGFKIHNMGGRDVLVEKIEVRGVEDSWSSVYYYRDPSGAELIGDMKITSPTKLSGTSVTLYGRTYNRSSRNIPLASGGVLFIYVKNPSNIDLTDLGTACSITVFTLNAQYIVETIVGSLTQQ